jgi:hypothetical protein
VVRLRAHPKYIYTQFPATPAPTSMARITQFTTETFLRRPLRCTEGAEVSLPKLSYTAQTVVDTASDDPTCTALRPAVSPARGSSLIASPTEQSAGFGASAIPSIVPPGRSSARARPVRCSDSSRSRGGDSRSRIAETAGPRPTQHSGQRLWRRRWRQGSRSRY